METMIQEIRRREKRRISRRHKGEIAASVFLGALCFVLWFHIIFMALGVI